MESSSTTLLSSAWRHNRVFVAVVASFVVSSLIFAISSGSSGFFQAEALLVLQDPVAVEGGGTGDRFMLEQIAILRSPIIASAAAEDLQESHPEYNVTAEELLAVPSVVRLPDSAIVLVSMVDLNDPDRAIVMVNGLVNAFQEASRTGATQSSVAAVERIDAQLVVIDTRLAEVGLEIVAVRNADVELAELRSQYRDALSEIARLQALLPSASDAQAPAIRQEITDYRGRIDTYRLAVNTAGVTSEMEALSLEEQQLIARRTDILQRGDEIAFEIETAPGAVSLLDAAEEAAEITQSSASRIVAVGLILGLAAAFGITYLLELRLRRFAGRREPEAILGAPLLADIPDFESEKLNTRLPVRDNPRSAAAESFRFAASSIEDALKTLGVNSVMVVGATLGHGKSTCIVNTAMANARQGHSALLIDGDFGNQDASRLVLGDDRAPTIGLTEVVELDATLEGAIQEVPFGDSRSLDLLGRGSRPTIAANLLSSAEAGAVFEEAKTTHDLLFVDAPPVLQVAYATTLANHVDALVVVVSHGSPMRELEELVDRLKLIDTPVIGYLYNRSPLRREMKASVGSMVDILGQGDVAAEPRGSWWEKERS
jgi:Mrp family chromosome partitioning ATPase